MTKKEKGYPKDQNSLIIINTFKGEDNGTLKQLCSRINWKIVIISHNLTNKFQPLDIRITKAEKKSQYNNWFLNKVSFQLKLTQLTSKSLIFINICQITKK